MLGLREEAICFMQVAAADGSVHCFCCACWPGNDRQTGQVTDHLLLPACVRRTSMYSLQIILHVHHLIRQHSTYLLRRLSCRKLLHSQCRPIGRSTPFQSWTRRVGRMQCSLNFKTMMHFSHAADMQPLQLLCSLQSGCHHHSVRHSDSSHVLRQALPKRSLC